MSIKVGLHAVAALGPGFENWTQLQQQLSGSLSHQHQTTVLAPSQQLPPTERRRIGLSVKTAMAVGEQLFSAAPTGYEAPQCATWFTSSGGDGDNCHQLCLSLTESPVMLSPTKFTNSVHNAPAGYFGIAHKAVRSSNSLCAHDGSFAQGLDEAIAYALIEQQAVALIAYDVPYPEPLNSKRRILAPMGVGLLLGPADRQAIAHLHWRTTKVKGWQPHDLCSSLLQVHDQIPAGRALPLLLALSQCLATTATAQKSSKPVQAFTLDAGQDQTLYGEWHHAG
jgi:hypothetical protein